jgi:hypothetical protein
MDVRLMRVEGKNVQVVRLFQELFQDVRLGDLRLRCREVFLFYGFVDLMPVNGNVTRRRDADFHVSRPQTEYGYLDLISNDKALAFFSREY